MYAPLSLIGIAEGTGTTEVSYRIPIVCLDHCIVLYNKWSLVLKFHCLLVHQRESQC